MGCVILDHDLTRPGYFFNNLCLFSDSQAIKIYSISNCNELSVNLEQSNDDVSYRFPDILIVISRGPA